MAKWKPVTFAELAANAAANAPCDRFATSADGSSGDANCSKQLAAEQPNAKFSPEWMQMSVADGLTVNAISLGK